MKTIRAIHKAVREDIGDLVTYRALPTGSVSMGQLDPFLFLNHHGPQVYPPGNDGLPFGPHPHRGFETVTFILDGELAHEDSSGSRSVIREGGVQWMTAGSGLVHAELSPESFKANGGPLEILQLWVNLPSRLKMTPPRYVGLQSAQLPGIKLDQGRVRAELISGSWLGMQGPVESSTGVELAVVRFGPGGRLAREVALGRTVFFYVVRGKLRVNGRDAEARELVEFDAGAAGEIEVTAEKDALLLLGQAPPLREPIAAYGPFVMNTREEIRQAIEDFNAGKFG